MELSSKARTVRIGPLQAAWPPKLRRPGARTWISAAWSSQRSVVWRVMGDRIRDAFSEAANVCPC
jgi:hypothetical protein